MAPARGRSGSGAGRRDEDEAERVNRELIELLNELRVALPGVQVLFAFMLILPFSPGFSKLSDGDRWVFFVSFVCAALGTALLIAPSAHHRLRFRQRDKEQILFSSNRMTIAGMTLVAVSMSGVVGLVTDVMFGLPASAVVAVLVGGWFGWFWYGLPLRRAFQDRDSRDR